MIIFKRFLTHIITNRRLLSESTKNIEKIVVLEKEYNKDSWTNIKAHLDSFLQRKLHLQKYHPLNNVKQCIENYFNLTYKNSRGNPLFSLYDSISPVVTTVQNFESLLTPVDHPARKNSDSFYINKEYMLRSHTTAHQVELMKMGLDNYLVIGDVYRRDEIDKSHYPVFHQVDGVRLLSKKDIFKGICDTSGITLFKEHERTSNSQGVHTTETISTLTEDLKSCLTGLVKHLYGKNVEMRWVDSYFPFTCPSWELEIKYDNEWVEVLGCGIMEQNVLANAGISDKVGWAFGIGLERLAMNFYAIPDIRYFWSTDPSFYHQFQFEDPYTKITFKLISIHPIVENDISFWLPENHSFVPNDFYDLVRTIAGDIVERVHLVDEFYHAKKKRSSQCYRIVYRSLEKGLSNDDVRNIHIKISDEVETRFGVNVRR